MQAAGPFLSPNGLGDITTGLTVADAKKQGYVEATDDVCSNGWAQTTKFIQDYPGVSASWGKASLDELVIGSAQYRTVAGTGVGSTVEQLRSAHGNDLHFESPYLFGRDAEKMPVLRSGEKYLLFQMEGTKVASISIGTVRTSGPQAGKIVPPQGC